MTPEDSIYRVRLRTLALAEELGDVRAACRLMGIHHSTYYRWKRQVEQDGLELLRPREFGRAVSDLGAQQRIIHAGRRPTAASNASRAQSTRKVGSRPSPAP